MNNMAKMKIYEIARSLQSQNKDLKSGDLVKLLNDNGFDVKGANINVEDEAIALLLKSFQNAPAKPKEEVEPKKEEPKKEEVAEKTEQVKPKKEEPKKEIKKEESHPQK